jgi:hypothetical protein
LLQRLEKLGLKLINEKWEIGNEKEKEYFVDGFRDDKGKSIPHNPIHDGARKMDEVRLTSKVKKAG